MAKCRQGIPEEGRAGNYSWYRSIYGAIMRIATNFIPKGRKSSEAQRLVQLALANWVVFWRSFSKMLRPTFEERKRGESEVNKFVSVNFKDYAVFLTKPMVEHGACVAVPACINCGTLSPSIDYWKDSAGDWMVSSILLGDLTITADTTVGEFSGAVIGHNYNGTKPIFTDKKSYLDFFRVEQRFDLNTHYPTVAVTGRHLMLDTESTEKLWTAVGGSEGYQSYKGHLATPFAQMNLYAWIHMQGTSRGRYRGTTQSLMGDNNAKVLQYSSEEAFMAACESYGGFDQKFLIPFRAKLNGFHYDLPTEETVAGQNPAGSDSSQGGGSTGDGPTTGGPGTVHEVTVTCTVQGGHGTVTPASHTVTFGSNISFTAAPDEGYRPDWPNGSHDLTYSLQARESTNITLTFSPKSSGGNQGDDNDYGS